MKLRNKVALITGASQGIGKGVAEIFAEEGADVAINHVGSSEKAREVADWVAHQGRRALVVEADVSQRSQVEFMFARVENELGQLRDVIFASIGLEPLPYLCMSLRKPSDRVCGCHTNVGSFCDDRDVCGQSVGRI